MHNPKQLARVAAMAIAAVATGAALWGWQSDARITHAPQALFKIIDGRQLDLQQMQGRPVLVTFWATTCEVCRKEMPKLIRLYEDLSPRGFQIVAVAMDYDPPNLVLELAKQRHIPYPVALDLDGSVAAAFGKVSLTPTSFLIAPDGRVTLQKTGELDMRRLRNRVLALLPAPARA